MITENRWALISGKSRHGMTYFACVRNKVLLFNTKAEARSAADQGETPIPVKIRITELQEEA